MWESLAPAPIALRRVDKFTILLYTKNLIRNLMLQIGLQKSGRGIKYKIFYYSVIHKIGHIFSHDRNSEPIFMKFAT